MPIQKNCTSMICIKFILVLCTMMKGTNLLNAAPILDNFLLFADGPQGKLFQMSLNGTMVMEISIHKHQNPVAVDYDPVDRRVYWSDVETRTIRRVKLEESSTEEPFLFLMHGSSPEGIAIDSVARLLFYTDNGRNTVNLVRMDNRDHKVIVAYARHPRAIQVDPINRNIYWTDWGLGTIERATYNGRHRTVLVEGQEKWINGLALDLLSHMMYWTDAYAGVIERANMDGSGKMILLDEKSSGNSSNITRPHYYGISLDGIYIYYTDWARGVFRVNIDGSNRQRLTPVEHSMFSIVNGIKAYRSVIQQNTQGSSSKCRQRNGGCSNFCIPLFNGYACDCPDFQHLADDNRTCVIGVDAVGPDVIWTEFDNFSTSYIRGIRGEPKDFLRTRDVFTWTLKSPAWHWTAIDINHSQKKLYLVDRLDRYIVQLSVKGSIDLKIILSGISSGVNGIAVDWIANNIYWTDGLYKWIAVAKAEENTKGHKTLLASGLEYPYSIAVWPQKGQLFWSDWGTTYKIQSATTIGERVNTLVSLDLLEPKGLVLDYENARLFWCNRNSIESISVNGTDRQMHAASAWNNFIGLALHMRYIIATEHGPNGFDPQLWIYDRTLSENSGFKLALARYPTAVVMYDSRRQELLASPCGQLSCEHLCITTHVLTAQCVCFDGFNLAADQKHCIENRQLLHGSAYIYSIGDRICSIPVQNSQTFVPNPDSICFFENSASPYEFRALDFNYRRGELYFSENNFRIHSIRRAHIVEKHNNSAVIHGIGLVKGIALDWMSENLYWTDASTNQIWMSRTDGRYQKIVARNLSGLHGIVIDMAQKKLYWTETDSKGSSRIAQANLDGSEISTLYENVERPTGLEIEYNSRENRLYWTDVSRNTIESLGLSSMTHRYEKIADALGKRLVDVALYQDFIIYTSSELNNASALHIFEKVDQREPTRGIRHLRHPKPFDVIVFAEAKQPLYNGPICGFADSDGCEQLLIQTNDGHCLCSCSDGFILNPDKKTCTSKSLIQDNFFLVADDYRHQIYQTDASFHEISAIQFPPYDRPISLDYDYADDRIYWTDFETSIIKRSFLNGSNLEIIHGTSEGSRIDGIAIAAVSRLLYFADSGKNEIGLMTLDGRHKKILLKETLSIPRTVVLDEMNGFLYYPSRNSTRDGGRINRCGMDGSNCLTLVKSDSSWPTSLAIDVEEKQLYWCDSHTEKIESANLDGSERRTIYNGSSSEDLFGLTLHGPYIYWTDWSTKGVSRVRRNGSGFERIFQDFFRGPNEIKFFSKMDHFVTNSCSEKNGGCSHFCIPTPNQGRICACPDVLKTDSEHDILNCSEIAVCSSVISNGHFHQQCLFTVGSSCRFTCNAGYGAATKELVTCQHDLQWSLDPSRLCLDEICPLLTNPENAKVDADCPQVAAVGVSCSQHCIDGYTWTDGDKVRTCGPDLTWTGRPIVCTAFTCAPLLSPTNAVVDEACPESSASPGAQCSHRCADGFLQIGGDRTRVCEKDVGWSGLAIVCTAVIHGNCPPILLGHGSHIEPETCSKTVQPVGSICQQFCQPGFLIVGGNYSRTCTDRHTWNGFPIVCLNQTAGEVGHPDRNHEVGLIVGLTIGMLIISALVIAVVVAMCRYGSPKSFQGRYHDACDFRFHRMDDDLQPVIPVGGLSASVYYTKHDSASPDGRVAFDNPAFGNNAKMPGDDRVASDLDLVAAIARVQNKKLPGDSQTKSSNYNGNADQSVFSNPIFNQPVIYNEDSGMQIADLENSSQSVA